jgi:hypothetical protein
MTLDVRAPVGVMFVVLGIVLAGYGILGDAAQYQRSLGINVNLGWGLVLLVFGAGLLVWRRATPSSTRPPSDR